jgi:predicted nucleotidyltransferase
MQNRERLGRPAGPGRGREASLAARRAEYAARLRESLDRIVVSLAALDEVERVSVFGSYARGRADLATDLDVLVVMRTDRNFVDRLGALYSRLAVPVDLDLLCYTPEEFAAMADGPFLRRIRDGEVVLYEKNPA